MYLLSNLNNDNILFYYIGGINKKIYVKKYWKRIFFEFIKNRYMLDFFFFIYICIIFSLYVNILFICYKCINMKLNIDLKY